MYINNILPIDGSAIATESKYGSKAHVISELACKGVSIPSGFCISHEDINDLYDNKLDSDSKNKLKESFERQLSSNSIYNTCIVRSSMSVEDDPDHQFPGIFNSYSDIATLDDLEKAIFNCLKSKESNKSHAYAGHFGIKFNEISVSIIVQEQIQAIYSGLAHIEYTSYGKKHIRVDYIEIIKGDIKELIQGRLTPSVFHIESYNKSKNSKIKCISELGDVNKKDIQTYLRDFETAFSIIRRQMQTSCVIEFGIDKEGLKVFQARPYSVRGPDPLRPIPPEIPQLRQKKKMVLENEKEIGLKGAAMKLFQGLSLFKEPVIFFNAKTPLFKIEEEINKFDFGDSGITVRFSKGDEIGLPRIFAANKQVALDSIFNNLKKDKSFIILHSYMDVIRSFELLVDEKHIILEHIPGLWEADNTLEPDVVIIEQTEATILRVKEKRQKIISSPESTKRIFENPEKISTLKNWGLRVIKICDEIIRPKFSGNLPLNFHFVETKSGNWNFLNIRRMVRLSKRYTRGGSFFHVRNINDLAGWDGKTPILLKLTVSRGDEKKLIDLAEALPKGSAEVFICFGYLSHPAIMMREFGVNLVPAYFDREIITFNVE
jgi:hypothetical protein